MSSEIICGNCVDVMKKLEDSSIDLTVTSPPYDNLRDYKGYTFDFESIARELYRVTKEGGVVVWVVGDQTTNGSESGTSFKQALFFKEIGFNLHDTMIYASGKPPLTHNRYEQSFEYMFVFSKGKPKTFNPIMIATKNKGDYNYRSHGKEEGAKLEKKSAIRRREEITVVSDDKIKDNIWNYSTGWIGSTSDKTAFGHPAIFPEALARDHIISWSNEGDTVLDPMCGSGTTLKMAHNLKRKYIGIDISEEYCKIARERLQGQSQVLL